MSLLSDTLFSAGSTRLHSEGGKNGANAIRKSKSHGGLLAPLRQLKSQVEDTLSRTATRQPSASESGSESGTDRLAADAQQLQILYLRKDNVGTWHW